MSQRNKLAFSKNKFECIQLDSIVTNIEVENKAR